MISLWRRSKGFTLVEMLMALAVIGIVIAVTIPATKAFRTGVDQAGTRSMISAALASARALAAKQGTYAGVRFQQDPNGQWDPNDGHLYMIFIVYDPVVPNRVNRFTAVKGIKPVKLPDALGVMEDLKSTIAPNVLDTDIDEPSELTNATTFSIVFTSAGKLAYQTVQVYNRDSGDSVFNTQTKVDDGKAMFYRDEDGSSEQSRKSFVVFDKKTFSGIDPDTRWNDYLRHLPVVYINPYTGTIISGN